MPVALVMQMVVAVVIAMLSAGDAPGRSTGMVVVMDKGDDRRLGILPAVTDRPP